MKNTKEIIESLDSVIADQIDKIEYHLMNDEIGTEAQVELLETAVELLEEIRGDINA